MLCDSLYVTFKQISGCQRVKKGMGGGRKKVDVTKDSISDHFGDGNILYLDNIYINIPCAFSRCYQK